MYVHVKNIEFKILIHWVWCCGGLGLGGGGCEGTRVVGKEALEKIIKGQLKVGRDLYIYGVRMKFGRDFCGYTHFMAFSLFLCEMEDGIIDPLINCFSFHFPLFSVPPFILFYFILAELINFPT